MLAEPPAGFEPLMLNSKPYKACIDEHVRNNFLYPEIAQEQNIQGRVLVQFIIDKEGKVKNLSIVKGAAESLDREVYRIFHIMPDWKPAKLNGEPIDVYITYPIVFKLNWMIFGTLREWRFESLNAR